MIRMKMRDEDAVEIEEGHAELAQSLQRAGAGITQHVLAGDAHIEAGVAARRHRHARSGTEKGRAHASYSGIAAGK